MLKHLSATLKAGGLLHQLQSFAMKHITDSSKDAAPLTRAAAVNYYNAAHAAIGAVTQCTYAAQT